MNRSRRSFGLICIAALSIIGCRPIAAERSPAADAYLQQAITLIRQRHINSSAADWPRIERTASYLAGSAQQTSDTHGAIRWVLAELGEPHSFLVGPDQIGAASGARAGSGENDDPMPTGRLVEGRYAWITLPTLSTIGAGGHARGAAYTEALKNTLLSLDEHELCGWVVDLRGNGGGNMWPMLNGLDPLLGAPPFGYFVLPGGQRQVWTRSENGIQVATSPTRPSNSPPGFRLRQQGLRLAVVIGPRTASSGEMVANALIGRSGVRTFGTRSAGLTTGNAVHTLSDGAILILTETAIAGRDGAGIRGPIQPQTAVADAGLVDAVEDWLEAGCRHQRSAVIASP